MRLSPFQPNKRHLSTKEVVAITGMTKDALRYYEQQQLIGPVPRNHNNYRQYSRQNLERLQFVATFRQLGLDLKLLSGDGNIPNRAQRIQELSAYRATVKKQIAQLQATDQFLAHKIAYFELLQSLTNFYFYLLSCGHHSLY